MEFEISEYNYLNVDLKGKRTGQLKTLCPHCSETRKNKKDPCLSVNIDSGVYNCHYCGKSGNIHKYKKITNVDYKVPYYHYNDDYDIPEAVIKFFADRAISVETMKLLKIDYELDIYFPKANKKHGAIVFPYFKNGICINKSFRDAKKNFTMVKDAEKTLYNLDSIYQTETAYFVEGQMDVATAVECGYYNTVSVPNGATTGAINLDYLDEIYDTHLKDKKKYILAGDNDTAGKNLTQKLAERLGKTRCWIVDWKDCKDGNEYLIKYGKEEYKDAINKAEPYPVSGVYTIRDAEEELLEEWRNGAQKGSPCHFRSLEPHFSWLKKDDIVFAGYPGMGKTEFEYFLNILKSIKDGWRWAIAGMEEKTSGRFYRKLVEMYVGMRIEPEQRDRYNNQMTENQLRQGMEFIREHFYYIRPEKFTRGAIFDAFDYTVARYGVDGIVIDPYNKIVKEVKAGLRDDELLVDYYRDCEMFAISHDVCAVTITHMTRPESVKDDIIPMPNAYSILGGQATNNAVDEILFVHRLSSNFIDPDRVIRVAKVRDRDIVGIPGDARATFDFRKRRFLDGDEDPIVGYGIQSKLTMPLPYKDDNDMESTDYIPF